MRRLAVVSAMLVLCPALASAADNDRDRRVRHQQGRVLTDSDHYARVRKIPGLRKAGDVTLKRGIISRDAAIKRRRALEPLTKRVRITRGIRRSEAEFVEKVRKWARQQDDRLLRLQKIHTAYSRLKSYRDRAAARGEDTSRIDPRLKGMKGKMADLSRQITSADAEFQNWLQQMQTSMKLMSNAARELHAQSQSVARNLK